MEEHHGSQNQNHDDTVSISSGGSAVYHDMAIEAESEENIRLLLQRTIAEMNAEFGEKRAQFKAMFLQKEEELEAERRLRQKIEEEMDHLRVKVNERQTSIEAQEGEKVSLIAKLREDLQRAAKLRDEMEAEWSQISDDFQSKLGKLEEQMSTYEVIIQELNTNCQHSLLEMERTLKKLTIERSEIQKKIEALEIKNDTLEGKHFAHSQELQNEKISLPNCVMELQEMVLRIKEDLITIQIGKEEVESQLKFLHDRIATEDEERQKIEESLNQEITFARTRLKQLEDIQVVYEEDKVKSERLIQELKTKLISSESSSSTHYKHNTKLIEDKVLSDAEISELKAKVATLRKELSSSEDLQRDLIALSKSLQIGLESIRQAETEVRWQHPDDISQCNSCRYNFNDSKEKANCNHCGRIFCKNCMQKRVSRGRRDYQVCDFCHTILTQDAAPYFSIQPPQQPD